MAENGMPSSFDDSEFMEESGWQKFSRKLKQEPLIPFGCAITTYALWRASRAMRTGDRTETNRMFRARLYGQSFTLVCMVGGSYYYKEERERRKAFEGALAEKRSMEKKEAWIRELEARDEEEKREKAHNAALIARNSKTPISPTPEDAERRKTGVQEAVNRLGGFGKS